MIKPDMLEEIELTASLEPDFASEAVAIDHLNKLLEERKQLVAIAEAAENTVFCDPDEFYSFHDELNKSLTAWKESND